MHLLVKTLQSAYTNSQEDDGEGCIRVDLWVDCKGSSLGHCLSK